MESVLIQEKRLPDVFDALLASLESEIEYCSLASSNDASIEDVAECLADAFAGFEINGLRICEPMVNACGLGKKDMYIFILEYLKMAADDGLCFYAKEKSTGRIIGAVACENFNPEEEAPHFDGSLEPMNRVIKFLGELDEKFINAIQQKTGRKLLKGELVHAFMAGAKLSKHKKNVIANLVELIMVKASQKGYKGIFAEATNIRSAKLLTDLCNFHLIIDNKNEPALKRYSEDELFKEISENIAIDCRILYKALHPDYNFAK